jgi:hypothetical protein
MDTDGQIEPLAAQRGAHLLIIELVDLKPGQSAASPRMVPPNQQINQSSINQSPRRMP